MRASLVGTTVLAAMAAAVVLPAGAASASTDTEAPKIVSVSAPSMVGKRTDGKATFAVNVRATDNIEIIKVGVGLLDAAGKMSTPYGVGFATSPKSGYTDDGVWQVQVTLPANFPLGGWKVTAYALDSNNNFSTGLSQVRDSLTLKWASRINGFNAAPATVAKQVAVVGKLQRVTGSGWSAYAGKVVTVQFQKKGSSTWTTRGTTVTAANGTFRLATKSPGAGSWRALYSGDSTFANAKSKVDTNAAQ
ncbi:MAG TPA: hypothetical protein VMZ00_10110 [Sporichthya sp.]|nr:hypothetical protein [Sporichthya sp.]